MDELVGKPGRGRDRGEEGHALGAHAGLLEQLAAGAVERVLAGVKLAGGDLHRHAAERRAVLPHQADAPVVGERHDRHGAGVAHHVADGLATVGQPHAQAVDVEDAAAPGDVLRRHVLGEGGVSRVVVAQHEAAPLGHAGDVVLRGAVAVEGERPGAVAHAVQGAGEKGLALLGGGIGREVGVSRVAHM